MGIDRVEARSWSKDRIKEEITDLRQLIGEWQQEIRDTKVRVERLQKQDMEVPYPGPPKKKIVEMDNKIDDLDTLIRETTADIEFLKSLL